MTFTCSECNKTFTWMSKLKIHSMIHTGERPYACDVEGCTFRTNQTGILSRHKLTHTKEKPYVCEFEGCGIRFTQKGVMKRHFLRHTGERPWKCDFPGCNYASVQSGVLARHKLTHTKPFVCDFEGCLFGTEDPEKLRVHKCSHTGERPYACPYDGCTFKAEIKFILNQHLLTHTKERPHACDIEGCNYRAAQSGVLWRHKQAMHTKEGIARKKRQEERVRRLLRKEGFTFESEVRVDFRCMLDNGPHSHASIDIQMYSSKGWNDGQGGYVLLEVDEGQHKCGKYSISCDMERMARIIESTALAGNDRPILFLRYNPGTLFFSIKRNRWSKNFKDFKVNGHKTYANGTERETTLLNFLKEWKFPDNDQRVFVKYLFYDMEHGVPSVTKSREYNPVIAKCVIS